MTDQIPDGMPTLSSGAHNAKEGEACVMEYISVLLGEEWTDGPEGVDYTISHMARLLNDYLPDKERSELIVPLIGKIMACAPQPFKDLQVNNAINRVAEEHDLKARHASRNWGAAAIKSVFDGKEYFSSQEMPSPQARVALFEAVLDAYIEEFDLQVSDPGTEAMQAAVAKVTQQSSSPLIPISTI